MIRANRRVKKRVTCEYEENLLISWVWDRAGLGLKAGSGASDTAGLSLKTALWHGDADAVTVVKGGAGVAVPASAHPALVLLAMLS